MLGGGKNTATKASWRPPDSVWMMFNVHGAGRCRIGPVGTEGC